MKSKSFSWSSDDTKKVGMAFVYVTLSTAVAGLIALFAAPDVDLPVWLGPIIPAANVFLYGAERWLSDNR